MKTKEFFFTDQIKRGNLSRKAQTIVKEGNALLELYKQVTGLQIQSVGDFQSLAVNPESFYKRQYFSTHKKKFAGLADLVGLDLKSLVSLPDEFSQVVNALNSFNWYSALSVENYVIENGVLRTSDTFEAFLDKHCSYSADTPGEQARLKFCLKMIDHYSQIETLLNEETHGVNMANTKSFVGDTVFNSYLIRVVEASTKNGTPTKMRLYPNPSHVKDKPAPRKKIASTKRRSFSEMPKGVTHIFPAPPKATASRSW